MEKARIVPVVAAARRRVISMSLVFLLGFNVIAFPQQLWPWSPKGAVVMIPPWAFSLVVVFTRLPSCVAGGGGDFRPGPPPGYSFPGSSVSPFRWMIMVHMIISAARLRFRMKFMLMTLCSSWFSSFCIFPAACRR